MKNTLIVSVSGIRGIVGQGLNTNVVERFTQTFLSLQRGKKLVVGTDTRPTRDMIKASVISAATSMGWDVIDIGIVPTPTLLFAVKNGLGDAGIAITASHNPVEWNALKLVNSKGEFPSPEETKDIPIQYESHKPVCFTWENIGKVHTYDKAVEDHIRAVLSLLPTDKIQRKKFKVVADCAGGASINAWKVLLEKLNCDVRWVHSKIENNFPRPIEPIPKHISHLSEIVKQHNADIGFATDADGDRLAIVTENGEIPGEEYTVALASHYVLSHSSGPVVINLSTSRLTEDVAERFQAQVFRSPVGEANVVKLMKEKKAIIGGEGNGGVIYPPLHYTRDSLIAIGLILSLLTEEDKPVSEIISLYPKYHIIKGKININEDTQKNLTTIDSMFPAGKINTDDGIRIDTKNFWVHIRKSGTEPIIRLIVEANSPSLANKVYKEVKHYLEEETCVG